MSMKIKCDYCLLRSCLDSEGKFAEDRCPKLQLWNEAMDLQTFLEEQQIDDPNMLVERLTMINAYMARSGYMLSQAMTLQDEQTSNVFAVKGAEIRSYPASMQKAFVQSQISDINGIVTLIERQNKTLVHQGDNIRTQISFAKQDIALQRKGY